jgi:hypothetical protein
MRNLEASPWLEQPQLIESKAVVVKWPPDQRIRHEFCADSRQAGRREGEKVSAKIPLPAQDRFQSIADDFRFMNPNDPGAWPLIPKITVLVGLFVGHHCCWMVVRLERSAFELETKQREEETLKAAVLDKKRQAVNLDLYIQQLAEIDRSFGALLKQLPDKSEIEALADRGKSGRSGARLTVRAVQARPGAGQGLLCRIADYGED